MELHQLRNGAKPLQDLHKEELFEKKVKKRKCEAGLVSQFQLPPFEDSDGGVVKCLTPAHPKADLWVALDPATLELCIKFMRSHGVEPDKKRAYNADEADDKLIKMGKGRLAKKQVDDDGKPKFEYVGKRSSKV